MVIDDGSTDNTKKILLSYSKKYNNVKVFSKKNSGVSNARNFGLSKATGEFVIFIDSDDYILKGYFNLIDNIISKNKNIDIIIFNHYIGNKSKITPQTQKSHIIEDKIISKNEAINKFLKEGITNALWDKVFKKNIINNVIFPLGITVGEDALFTIKSFLNSNRIYLSNKFFYVYMQDTEGVTKGSFSNKKLQDITYVVKEIKHNLQDKFDKEKISLMIYNQLFCYIISTKTSKSYSEIKFFLENVNNIRFKKIRSIKKKIYFLIFKMFYMFTRKK